MSYNEMEKMKRRKNAIKKLTVQLNDTLQRGLYSAILW